MESNKFDNKLNISQADESKYLANLGPELFNLIKNNMEKIQNMEDGEEKERLVKEILIAINKKNELESARKSYKKIEKASTVLAYGWVANNLLGLILTIFSIYFIWFKWHMGLLGILVFVVSFWFINSVLLYKIFGIFNKPFAEMAKSGAVRLGVLGVISEEMIRELANTKVEYWPKYIVQSLTEENIKLIFGDQNKKGEIEK